MIQASASGRKEVVGTYGSLGVTRHVTCRCGKEGNVTNAVEDDPDSIELLLLLDMTVGLIK